MEVYGEMDSQWRCMEGWTHSGGVWRDGHSQWRCMEEWTLTVEVHGGMDSQWRCMEGWTLTVEVYGGMDTHSGGVWRMDMNILTSLSSVNRSMLSASILYVQSSHMLSTTTQGLVSIQGRK